MPIYLSLLPNRLVIFTHIDDLKDINRKNFEVYPAEEGCVFDVGIYISVRIKNQVSKIMITPLSIAIMLELKII